VSGARTVRTFVVTSVLVLRQTGGNLVEVHREPSSTRCGRQNTYERKLRAMTAEGRASSRMLGGLPIVFLLLSYAADPNYVGMLFKDPIGNVLFAIALTLYLLGMFWIRRLVNPAR
jgi:tight adherence protein B